MQKDGYPPQSERAAQVARYRWIHESTDQGTYGDPTFGSAEKGERFIRAAVEVLLRIVEDIRRGTCSADSTLDDGYNLPGQRQVATVRRAFNRGGLRHGNDKEPAQNKLVSVSLAARDAQCAQPAQATFGGCCKRWGIWVCWRRRAAGAWYAAEHWSLPWLLLILFLHGTFYAFLLNGFHELCHSTVFKSKFLNYFFLRVFSFLGALQPHPFLDQPHRAPQVHPAPPDDLEVVLPAQLRFVDFLKSAIVNPWGLYARYKDDWAAGIWEIRGRMGAGALSRVGTGQAGDGSFVGIASCWWDTP